MYRVVIHRRVVRYLRQLPPSLKESIKESLEVLAKNPYQSNGIKAMKGEWQGYYRMRVREMRIIYWVDTENLVVFVDYVGHRGDVYKT
jgi:mRNA interferase RelE/StbE